jgi:AmmeMemoRadiSam system protein A
MEINTPDPLPNLSREAQEALLRVARASIAAALRGEAYAPPEGLPPPCEQPGAAFVSLHAGGDLRGCIGMVRTLTPLASVVAHCARAAALEDPRFPPLGAEELARVDIEISVLGQTRPLPPGALPRPGVDGVVVSWSGRQGLLLPQVATEQGWDGKRLLEEACLKAGLEREAWAHGARAEIFQARVFSERSLT